MTPVEDDGIVFDPDTIDIELITEDADYHGLRVHFNGKLESARVTLQLDIGFWDILVPGPKEIEYPSLLGHTRPSLIGYSMESMIAEKFEAMVKLGIANSRMKDFYDIWLLSRQHEFNGATLMLAIKETFKHRGTAISLPLFSLSSEFSQNAEKQKQWKAYVNRNNLVNSSTSLEETIMQIREFLSPVLVAITENNSFARKWLAAQRWIPEG